MVDEEGDVAREVLVANDEDATGGDEEGAVGGREFGGEGRDVGGEGTTGEGDAGGKRVGGSVVKDAFAVHEPLLMLNGDVDGFGWAYET